MENDMLSSLLSDPEALYYASGQQLLVVNLCHVLDEHQQLVGVAPLNSKG